MTKDRMRIALTNVRGFAGAHTFNIRPITILLGENSSGKTTLLASLYAILNKDFPTADSLLNRAPFDLGSFDTVATYRGGAYGRATSFELEWSINNDNGIRATFRNADGTAKLDSFEARLGLLKVTGTSGPDGTQLEATKSTGKSGEKPITARFTAPSPDAPQKTFRFQELFRYYLSTLTDADGRIKDISNVNSDFLTSLQVLPRQLAGRLPHVTALSPLRTRPRRTYDELNDEFKPEGDHVPLILSRLLAAKQKGATAQLESLMRYGRASGLFEKIDVKRLGKQPSDPFQVRIKMKGPDANLVDVGYGVSQALPIVVEAIMAPDEEMLLIQQPEVHLHPRAQAALGTFFAELVASSKKQFVIETHSDYLVDRVRLSVTEGIIAAKDVQLIYLERAGLDINVHQIDLDENGNLVNAPAGYRKFFLQEEIKLMTRLSK
jgi:energy-coupling factor transporter ATP-binding protein EcfA2